MISKPIVALLVALLAQGSVPRPGPASPALPWLYNLDNVTAVDAGDPMVAVAMEAEIDPSCDEGMPSGLSLVADVAPAAGPETILASFAHGVMVYGREGQLIASTPGFPCAGSADEIEVLAVGTAFGVPTIVIAATTGGRREQLTWLGLYRIGLHGRLEAVFAGGVEYREDGIVRRGSVTILPEALLVRDPRGGVGLWVFDPSGGVYVPRGGLTGEERPHS
jgi:hypothetical protein